MVDFKKKLCYEFEMSEPPQLRRGKRFQKIVQSDFLLNSKGGTPLKEETIDLTVLNHVRQKSGRMDIFISEDTDDFVTILEIKATNWDHIKPKNITRNLWWHQRKIFMYIDKYVDHENLSVCPGIIYPYLHLTPGLRERIETYLGNYGAPDYWYMEMDWQTGCKRAVGIGIAGPRPDFTSPSGFVCGSLSPVSSFVSFFPRMPAEPMFRGQLGLPPGKRRHWGCACPRFAHSRRGSRSVSPRARS